MTHEDVVTEIQLPRDMPEIESATVQVRIEDTSVADAPALQVAEQVLRAVHLMPGQLLEVVVPVPRAGLEASRTYTARVHISPGGGTTVQRGSLVSTQSHPVLTQGAAPRVLVPVQRVR